MGTGWAHSPSQRNPQGRWPANAIFSHSLWDTEDGCAEDCPVRLLDEQGGYSVSQGGNHSGRKGTREAVGGFGFERQEINRPTDAGGPSRFFYVPKASTKERTLPDGTRSTHPTMKPQALMAYLIRLITPPGGTVLDPFAGSGTTLIAAQEEGFDAIGIEREAEYVAIAEKRLAGYQSSLLAS